MPVSVVFGRADLWINVGLISAAWCFAVSALFTQVSVTNAASQDIGSRQLSTVALGFFTLTAAISVIPSLYLMRPHRLGRRRTFLLGVGLATIGAGVNIAGIITGQVALLIIGAVPQGASWAASLNYRYLATAFIPLIREDEPAMKALLPRVLAVSVLGGAAAAAVGPEATKRARQLFPEYDYLGSYVVLLLINVAHALVLLFIRFDSLQSFELEREHQSTAARDDDSQSISEEETRVVDKNPSVADGQPESMPALRALWTLIKSDRNLINGLLATAIGYTVMVSLMNGSPLAAREVDYSFDYRTILVEVHLLGMFLPSLVSGNFTQSVGKQLTVVIGFAIMMLASGIYFIGGGYAKPSLAVGVVTAGVGWNLTFVAGSSLIAAASDDPEERARIQGVADTLLTSTTAVAILVTGALFESAGWIGFNSLQLAIATCAFIASSAFYVAFKREIRKSTQT